MVDKKQQFLVCPDCAGDGEREGQTCAHCHGRGVALFVADKVLFWGKYYETASLAVESLLKKVRVALNMILALFGLSGIGLIGYFGYIDNFQNFFSLEYWLTASPEKLYFWITLAADLYLYYRLSDEGSARYRVLVKKYAGKNIGPAVLDWPSVWQLKKDKQVDASLAFTSEAERAAVAAYELAKHFGHNEVNRVHLLGILFQFDKSAIILARLGINSDSFKKKISRYFSKNVISRAGNPLLSAELQKTLLLAYALAYENGHTKVDMPDLVAALASPEQTIGVERDDVLEILLEFNLNYQKVKNVVVWMNIQEELRSGWQRFQGRARYKPKSGMDRAMTAVSTDLLNQFSEDMTYAARAGAYFPCLGRTKEFEQIFRVIEGSRQGVLLIGGQGVGRTAILQGLAQRMVSEDVPEILQDKRLVSLNIASILSGADPAMAEERLLSIVSEVIRAGNVVLVVENVHNLSGISVGGEGGLDLAEVFAQYLNKHLFFCLGTTTPAGFAESIEEKSLAEAFMPVKVEELELNDAIQVLEAKSGPIEYQNKVYFSYDAIEKAATLSARYIHDKYLPEKALEILEQAAIRARQERGENKVVSGEDVAEIISGITKIPVTAVSQKEGEKLLHLEEKIHERMISQDEAVTVVAASLRRARAELREGKRPIASLLFLGPTGVGKTELAKTVSEVYFGNEKSMLRFDMSEYQEQNSIGRLIGLGKNAGLLTEAVRKAPFSLVLFDEVEKAHPEILNLFLQVMDDGRLTDAQGRTVDFTNTIIIMTSNAGAQFIQDEINAGTAMERIKESLLNEKLKQNFRPEFLNRFDGTVVFKPLTMADVIKIARILIEKVAKRLAEKGIEFSVADEAVAELAEMGFDPKFGARPLRRVIQDRIDDALAKKLLQGELVRRDKVVYEVGGNLRVEKAQEL